MIRQEIFLDKEQWHVIVYYAVTHFELDEIMRDLSEAGCKGNSLASAYRNLSAGILNTGLCFSGDGTSILVVSVASSAKQFFNSLAHELHHLATFIGMAVGYDLKGEGVCYLAGEIAQEMYPVASKYLCECCRGG